jgi:spore germination cell wall hydrolase CwlJ-like protein
MSRSRLGWAFGAIAPWCIALGLVVSITAKAGQDASIGASVASRSIDTASPIQRAVLAGAFHLPDDYFDHTGVRAMEARLALGDADDLSAMPDEIEPRPDAKGSAGVFPSVNRASKGDPFIGLRPAYESRARTRGATNQASEGGAGWPPTLQEAPQLLFPGPPDLAPAAGPVAGDAPHQQAHAFDDGATPSLPLDIALNSASPQPNDGAPIIIAPIKPPETTIAQRTLPDGRPDYAALIDPRNAAREQQCLAEAIYFEARSEPEDGQAAVAQVVLNRLRSGLYPASVCGVVYQDRNRPFACQFSFACEGKSLRITEPGPWAAAVRIGKAVTDGAIYNPQVGSAVNYHANYVMPYWASTLKRVDRIGHHIFYQLRVGQNAT